MTALAFQTGICDGSGVMLHDLAHRLASMSW